MTTGFIQRFKGKIRATAIWASMASATGGLFDSGSGARLSGVWNNAGAPTNGTGGTFANYALPGDLLEDTTNLRLYQNTNTKVSPTWTPVVQSDNTFVGKAVFLAPLPADLISVVAAVTPSNVALTIIGPPPQARKLQIRIVIGTTTTTAITAGALTLVGVDQDGNAVTEVISLIENASATVVSRWAYASLTSATVSAYAASGSGTGNTIGIGLANAFGIPTAVGVINFALVKATKIITTFVPNATASNILWSRAVTDDVAGTATVDAVARTVIPTTAPGVAGINDYEFTCSFGVA